MNTQSFVQTPLPYHIIKYTNCYFEASKIKSCYFEAKNVKKMALNTAIDKVTYLPYSILVKCNKKYAFNNCIKITLHIQMFKNVIKVFPVYSPFIFIIYFLHSLSS
jgi:hypothetical protein